MKTTNIILIGVVGVGAVGAYMYMKNKQAQNALLSGSLPATNLSGTAPSGTAPSGTAPSGTAPSGTASQNNEVFLPSDNDLKLVDATLLLGKIKKAQLAVVESKKPFTGRKDWYNRYKTQPEYLAYLANKDNTLKALKLLMMELHNLDYELDANNNLVKLNPNRDKQKHLKAIGYQFDVIALKEKMSEPFDGKKFSSRTSTDENKPSDWTNEYRVFRNAQKSYEFQIEKLLNDLDDVDFTLDNSNNLVKLDPNRNKEWIRVQKLYLSLVNLDQISLVRRNRDVIELAKYGYKIDPITKKLIKI
jgi:hypothetical protein